MGHNNSRSAKDIRRAEAQDLLDHRSELTDQEQIMKLNGMFGTGQGAVKERARLAAYMAHDLGERIVDALKRGEHNESESIVDSVRMEESPSYRSAMNDSGRGHLLR